MSGALSQRLSGPLSGPLSGDGGAKGPFNPATDIPLLLGWYNSNDPTTLFADVAGTIPATTIVRLQKDKSGNGNDRTQPTAGREPTCNTATINSKVALRCATNQGMLYPARLYNLSNGEFTIYKIFRSLDTVQSTTKFATIGGDGGNKRFNSGYNVSGTINSLGINSNNSPLLVASYPNATQDANAHLVVMGVRNSTTLFITQDGDAGAVASPYVPYAMTTFAMENGGTAHTTTDHGEELLIGQAIIPGSTLDLQITNYMKSGWNTPNAFAAPTSTLRTAATQNRLLTGQQTVAGTDSFLFNVPKYVPRAQSAFAVDLNHWYRGVSAEIAITGSITIQELAIYNDAGTYVGTVLFGGAGTKTLASGDYDIVSDLLVGTFPPGIYWIKGRGTMTTGANLGFTAQLATDVTNTQFYVYTAASNTASATNAAGPYTFTGAGTPTSQARGYAPMLLGIPVADDVNFAITGDSIAEYVNDAAATIHGDGWFQRAMGDLSYPSMNLAQNGSTTTLFTTGVRWRSFLKYLGQAHSYIVDEGGTNNIGSGALISSTALTDLENSLKNLWNTYKQYGVKGTFRSKYPNRTSGTFTSSAQTPLPNYAAGATTDTLHTFFAANVGNGIDYLFDFPSIKDTTNTYIWRFTPQTTLDGLHPNGGPSGTTGSSLMATDFKTAIAAANVS